MCGGSAGANFGASGILYLTFNNHFWISDAIYDAINIYIIQGLSRVVPSCYNPDTPSLVVLWHLARRREHGW